MPSPWPGGPGWGRRGVGTGIGLLSAMMGVGGGSFGGMTMTLCGRPIHQAVATASAIRGGVRGSLAKGVAPASRKPPPREG